MKRNRNGQQAAQEIRSRERMFVVVLKIRETMAYWYADGNDSEARSELLSDDGTP